MKKILLKFLRQFLIEQMLKLFKILEDEAARTHNDYDDKTVEFVKARVIKYIYDL